MKKSMNSKFYRQQKFTYLVKKSLRVVLNSFAFLLTSKVLLALTYMTLCPELLFRLQLYRILFLIILPRALNLGEQGSNFLRKWTVTAAIKCFDQRWTSLQLVILAVHREHFISVFVLSSQWTCLKDVIVPESDE